MRQRHEARSYIKSSTIEGNKNTQCNTMYMSELYGYFLGAVVIYIVRWIIIIIIIIIVVVVVVVVVVTVIVVMVYFQR